ncbi:IclR family transcriptional regulator [Oryzicola mucosus]|uniref:IclR family transcriptional regulator n=1 Tax=Oryzicola mucosus TaxID=2767425 RepID=A0A8J6TZX0_9HYPH|nr:IclR family transcriptional regulator [Oryzicola mucosus]MBD0416799.1 IclR family transcriptional regulator [Oryzicola mucosus]
MSTSDLGLNQPKGQRNEMRMIARAAAVLRAIAESGTALSLGQLAKKTDLPRATVQRLVGALEAERFVITDATMPGVRLGSEVARLAALAHQDPRAVCKPWIQWLSDKINESVDLTVLQGDSAIVIDQVLTPHPFKIVTHIGTALPVHCTASGKAHLSQMSIDLAARILDKPLLAHTENTITDKEILLSLVGTDPSADRCTDNEEYVSGVVAVALPIRGLPSGNYAIAVSMARQSFLNRRLQIADALTTARGSIERSLGLDENA